MAEESGIYAEDIVKNSQGIVGLVVEDAEETSDESDSEEESLKKGQIVVCWYPSGHEETLSVSKVKLADRSLLPGDVLKFSNANKGTQKGFVSNVDVVASVKVLVANQIFHNVDCKELSPLTDFSPGVNVSMGPWLGTVVEVYRKVVLRIKNGSRCSLEGEQSSMLYDLSDQRDEDSPFYSASYYPGQRVAGPARVFKEARWLSGVKPLIHNQATIRGKVEEASVIACDIDWQVCGACQHCVHGDKCIKPPDSTVTQDQLHRLLVVDHFRHASLQIGDKAFYTLKASDLKHAASTGSSLKQQTSDNDNIEGLDELAYTSPPSDSQTEGCSVHEGETSSEVENAGLTNGVKHGLGEALANLSVSQGNAVASGGACLSSESSTTSFYSAENESRNASESTSATSLCDTHHSVHAETSSNKKDSSTCDANEAASANAGNSQADIHDDHPTGSDSADADEDSDGVEVVIPKVKGASIAAVPKHDSPSSHGVRYPTKRRKKRLRRKRKAAPPLKVNVGDKVCVEVTHTRTTVDVIWQDGTQQDRILSTDLIPVLHLDELEFFPGDYVSDKRENAISSNYGVVLTADHKSRLCHVKWFSQEGQELSVENDVSVFDIVEHADFKFNAGDVVVRVAKNENENEAAEPGVERPTPCVGQVTRVDEEGCVSIRWVDGIVSNIKPQELFKVDTEDDGHPSSDGSTVASDDDGWETASGESTEEEAPGDIMDNATRGGSSAGDEGAENVDREVLQEANNRINEIMSNTNPAFMTFDHFPEEHIYFYTTFQARNPGHFLTCLRKEMALLMFSLPAGIIVRGYENRVDIFRVMITGPVDTPYEHGLFAFDVRLPPDYPASPPVFFYLSQCSGRLNPNLYEDGKVCVSLLGTWSGRGSEVWTSKSNILQVLVSIQGLILCSEPYYNEAGYEKQRGTAEGHENSRLYNEMVLLKLVQSMGKLIKKPPIGLEKEILQHFTHHGPRMLQKFKRWIELSHEQATTVPACDNEHTVENHATVGGLEPKEEKKERNGENELAYSNGVAQNGAMKEAKDPETRGASCVLPSAEGKTLNVENQGACQGAMSSEKNNVPDYPLFPLSRGFCLSLGRALQSFQTALEKARLPDCT